jgi:hypothetical protein
MATDFQISLQMPSIDQLVRVINGATFPLAAQAVRRVAMEAQSRWVDSVYRATIWSGMKQPYMQSIKIRYIDDLHYEVYSDYKYAEQIEEGMPPRDLKMMLNTSNKVRVSAKTGKRFLVIPMRQNTPNNAALAPPMPTSVYELAREMIPSSVTDDTGARQTGEVTHMVVGQGMFPASQQPHSAGVVPRMTYKWGDRLTKQAMKAAGIDAATRKRYAGMVRMDASTPGAKSSVYLTFRVMAEGSSGWITKPKPGLHLVQNVVTQLQPLATAAIGEAMKRMSQT